jgi:hypothetical protein
MKNLKVQFNPVVKMRVTMNNDIDDDGYDEDDE